MRTHELKKNVRLFTTRLNDICGKERDVTTWRISIETEFNDEHGAHLAISLTPKLAPGSYQIRNEKPYRLDEWIQIAIAYDSHQLLLHVNGARVDKLVREFGVLYSEIRSACKKLYLAIDSSGRDQIVGFRGYIGKLRISDRFMNHSELIREQWEGNVTEEKFSDFRHWKHLGSHLGIRKQEILQKDKPRNIEIPYCGQTVCDNPTVESNYLHQWNLQAVKKLKYRQCEYTDGSAMRQHAGLLKAFASYNITWDLEVINIRNTSLRRKTIVFGCRSSVIGNKRCDTECCRAITGDDGGDCKMRYINVEEYKAVVGVDNENGLTVQFGGILLRYDRFGTPGQINNLIHETGHILGLWHVHHGTSEVPCSNPCDMLSDTNPTVKNTARADPETVDPCDATQRFKSTPFRNYMSYKMWASPLSSMNCGPRQKGVQETHCTTDRRVIQ
uniref:Bm9784 n=1 Tax=Brugia malayi TaxID=6279 RepID=A0A0H5S603_BRUMA|nr:Bm9784 [Brugia malayi]